MALPPLLELMGAQEAQPKRVKPHHPTGWALAAYDALCAFLAPGKIFTAEAVRRNAEENGCPKPGDPRAWGGIMQRAEKDGKVKRVGYAKSTNRQAHKRPVTIWQAK